jgi:hypothetical protein
MEKIESTITTVVSRIIENAPAKSLFFCPCAEIEGLVTEIRSNSRHFGLFIAADASRVSSERVRAVANVLIGRGLAWLCTWGPDCERVHDSFDLALLEFDPQGARGVIMTTWHDDEPLSEAIWFFVSAASPDKSYEKTCLDWIVAGVGTDQWNENVRTETIRIASQEN